LTVPIPFKLARIAADVRKSLAAEAAANADPNAIDPGQSPPIVQLLAAQSSQTLSPGPLTQSTSESADTNDSQAIPSQIAQDIVDRLCRRFSPRTSLQGMANFTRDVWERIHARPPGIGATIGLLFAYGFCFTLSLAGILGLAAVSISEHDSLESHFSFESKIVEYQDEQGQTQKKEQLFMDGRLAGENQLDPNGTLYHGKRILFDPNGNLFAEGAWRHGRKDGQWKEYDLNGNPYRITTFDKGKFVSQKSLENGRWIDKGWDDLAGWERHMFTRDMEGPPRGPNPPQTPPAKSDRIGAGE
jgi:hypothetical protein